MFDLGVLGAFCCGIAQHRVQNVFLMLCTDAAGIPSAVISTTPSAIQPWGKLVQKPPLI